MKSEGPTAADLSAIEERVSALANAVMTIQGHVHRLMQLAGARGWPVGPAEPNREAE